MKTKLLIIGLVSMAFAACSSDEPTPDTAVEFELTASESRAAEETRGFNIDFFQAVCETEKTSGTIVTSPLSAKICLSMLANGCVNETRKQIAEALGCSDISALNSLASKYMLTMPYIDSKANLTIANSVWYHNTYSLNAGFAETIDKYYAGEKYARDFRTDDQVVVDEINNWVSDKTKNLIDRIVNLNDIRNSTVIMANALYFKSVWASPFKKENTTKKDFYGVRTTETVDMMYSEAAHKYAQTKDFQAVKLPFGNGAFEAVVILPSEETDINTFIASGVLNKLANLQYNNIVVDLSLPKFKIETRNTDLMPTLERLGIEGLGHLKDFAIFTERIETGLSAYQTATIEFTEEGAEGSAATWVMGDIAATEPNPARTVMNVNRPFVFFINETTTGACLFATRVTDL